MFIFFSPTQLTLAVSLAGLRPGGKVKLLHSSTVLTTSERWDVQIFNSSLPVSGPKITTTWAPRYTTSLFFYMSHGQLLLLLSADKTDMIQWSNMYLLTCSWCRVFLPGISWPTDTTGYLFQSVSFSRSLSRSSTRDAKKTTLLQTLLLKFLPSDSNHFFIGTNMVSSIKSMNHLLCLFHCLPF